MRRNEYDIGEILQKLYKANIESLDTYSDNTTLRISNSMTSDETLLKMEDLIKDNPTEQELIKRLDENFPRN